MVTMLDIVTGAFRKIRVAGPDEPIEAEFASEGIDVLNDMLHEWVLRGVNLEYSDLALSDEFPLPPQFRDGTKHMLAGRLRSSYARPREFDEDDFFRAIQAAYMVIDSVETDSGLTRLPSTKLDFC